MPQQALPKTYSSITHLYIYIYIYIYIHSPIKAIPALENT